MASNSRRDARNAIKKAHQEAAVTKAAKTHKSTTTPIEEGVRDRIQECLDRAELPDTLEKTLIKCLFLAVHRLMRKRNVAQAGLTREREEVNECKRELDRLRNLLPVTTDRDGINLGNVASNESEETWDKPSDHLEPMDVDESVDDMKSIKTEEVPEEETDFNENGRRIRSYGDVDDDIDKLLNQELPET